MHYSSVDNINNTKNSGRVKVNGESWIARSASDEEISVEQLKLELDGDDDLFLLDVREPEEFQICRIPGSTLIPLSELPSRLVELEGRSEMVVHCKSGVRSAKAVKLLREAGFKKAKNLSGGILRWIDVVDPSLPKY